MNLNNKLIISVKGNINKFLLKCNINLLKVRYISNKEIIITINESDYKKLLKVYGFKYHIKNKKGFIKIKELCFMYKYFIYSCIIGFIFLLLLSNIIFDINVICDNKDLKELIEKELINYNIDRFKLKKSYKKNEIIKKEIIKKYKDKIEWLEIKNNGVKIEVNVLERKIKKEKNNIKINNIVAKKSGFIKKVVVEDGIKLIEENNYVNKGDVIISSDIYLNEELKERKNAKGKVYAEVWYKVKVEYPLNTLEKEYTNKNRNILFLKINNNYFELFKYKKYERKNKILISDKLTNVSFGLENIKEVIYVSKKYDIKTAKKLAINKAKEEINKRLGKDEYIIDEKTLNFTEKNSKIYIDIFFSVYEEISKEERVRE